MSFEAKLHELGLTIEPLEPATGRIVPAKRSGSLIFTSGQVPDWQGRRVVGKVGRDLGVDEAYEAARLATLNCLRAIKTLAGSLDNVTQIVKVFGMVNAAPDWSDTPAVIHGASDLLLEVFGGAGRHARSAVGLVVPLNYAVEIEMVVEVA